MYREEGTGASFALGLFAGAVIGAGVALLFAPKAGNETRELLGQQYRGLADRVNEATETLKEQARERSQQITSQLSDRVSSVTERLASAADRATDRTASATASTADRLSSSAPSI
jgi:gas vesicle protein